MILNSVNRLPTLKTSKKRRAHRPDENTIEKLRKKQSEKLKRINSKSEEELKSRLAVPEKVELREKEPEGKNVKFNSTLEDVCTIGEIDKDWVVIHPL